MGKKRKGCGEKGLLTLSNFFSLSTHGIPFQTLNKFFSLIYISQLPFPPLPPMPVSVPRE